MDKIRVLELFSGTHSIGKECEKRGWQVYSLDRDLPNFDKLDNLINADICYESSDQSII